jgi:hypothetical protein
MKFISAIVDLDMHIYIYTYLCVCVWCLCALCVITGSSEGFGARHGAWIKEARGMSVLHKNYYTHSSWLRHSSRVRSPHLTCSSHPHCLYWGCGIDRWYGIIFYVPGELVLHA